MNRRTIVYIHRVFGLSTAILLTLLGITGSVLVWEEELDSLLSANLLMNRAQSSAISPPELIRRVQHIHPNLKLDFLLYPRDKQRSAIMYVSDFETTHGVANQLLVDRNNGKILGSRNTLTPRLSVRSEILPWIYQFHYSLLFGSAGALVLGIVALLWFFDSLIAWYLTLPRRFAVQSWLPAWSVNRIRLSFDIHRATGLWLTPIFAVLAFTGIYFNLYEEVFLPAVSTVSSISVQPYQQEVSTPPVNNPHIEYAHALAIGYDELERRGVSVHALDYLAWNPTKGYYVSAFYTGRDLSRDSPSAHVYVNHDGSIRHVRIIGEGTMGDTIVDWQFPLHSGQAFGLLGRLLVCLSGIALAVLSTTGVVIWWRKLRARTRPRKSYEGRTR